MTCARVRMFAYVYCTLLFYIVTIIYSVDGRTSFIINDKSKKTIKTEYGDIYDCVNVHEQPSLNHPLLKGHKIQMSFTSQLGGINNTSSSSLNYKEETISSKINNGVKIGLGDWCPKNTVPIKRITKEEQLNAESSFQAHFHPNGIAGTGFEFAGVSTTYRDGVKYEGGGGYVSIYNPDVDAGEFSTSLISLEDGSTDEFSVIRFGWMVNPTLYGDKQTRLFTIWGQSEDGMMHGCYNMYCPGFIILSRTTPLDHAFLNVSVPRGPQNFIKLNVVSNKDTGDLYLFLTDSDSARQEVIGYWPKALFRSFEGGAAIVRWGGLVYSDTGKSPPMGSGREDCRFKNLWLKGDANGVALTKLESRCYKVGVDNDQTVPLNLYSFWFGGMGGYFDLCH